MPQYDLQIHDLERIFQKRYKIVIFIVACTVGFSSLFVYMKPPVFTAASTVQFNRSNVMGLSADNMGPSASQGLPTQTRIITSSPVLLRAAKKLSLVPDSVSEENYSSNENILKSLESIRAKIAVSNISGTDIIQIQVTTGNAAEARDLANTVAKAYKEFSLEIKKREAFSTRKFIEGQLQECRADLLSSQQDVKIFQESQKVPSLDRSAEMAISKSQALELDQKRIDDDISVIMNQKQKLTAGPRSARRAAGAGPDSIAGDEMSWVSTFTDPDPGLQNLNNRLIQLQIQLEDQRSFYKPDHPANVELKHKIGNTKSEIIAAYDKKLSELRKERTVKDADRIENLSEIRRLPDSQMRYARLLQRLKVNDELFVSLTKKLNEAQILEAGVVDDVTIMSIATIPSATGSGKKFQMLFVGILLGILLGILVAVMQEIFDSSIGTIEEVEQTLKLPVLAVVPHIMAESEKQNGYFSFGRPKTPVSALDNQRRLITQFKPKDPCAEAYRILRSNLEFLSYQSGLTTLLVSSATKQEGKSHTVSNIAIAFAQKGKKVLLLECNLRRPTLYKYFGLEKSPGITDILIKKEPWHKCVKNVSDLLLGNFPTQDILKVPGLDNLHFITFGQTPLNPAELLSSPAMDALLADVKPYFDIVLIDCPPILPVADSMQLATKVDGVLLVYRAGKVSRSSVRLAKQRLETVKAKLLGVVLNDIKPETSGIQYSRVYVHYYGKDELKHKKLSKNAGTNPRVDNYHMPVKS